MNMRRTIRITRAPYQRYVLNSKRKKKENRKEKGGKMVEM